ncbi:MAG: trigger factor [Candidatus Latescibacterota bacterium]|nr:MAG: trigger factor [Candidatus Latescibacterota bacterium]
MNSTQQKPSIELQVTTAAASGCARVLTIEFARGHYDDERERVLRELRRRITRPGFRKGKVPRDLIEREFGERIRAESVENLIPAVCQQAIEQEGLDVVSTPNIRTLDLENPQAVRMEVEVDVRPRLQLVALEALRAAEWRPEVRDEEIEQELERVREQNAQFEAVERPAQDGDFLLVSYVPLDEQGEERTGQRVDNYPFQLGEGQVVAEFEAAVRGLSPGETARAEVQYAADHDNQEIAGRLVAFVLTLKEVKEKHLPELDDDLARDLGVDNLETLRERMRDELERRLKQESERDLREKLIDAMIAAHPFDVPATMVEKYLDAVTAEYEERHRRMQVEVEPQKRDEFRTSARPSAERAVRRMLIVDHLQTEHDLRASEEDVDNWIEEKVQAEDSEPARVRGFFADPDRRRRLRNELSEERVFEFVKSKAQVETVPRPQAP